MRIAQARTVVVAVFAVVLAGAAVVGVGCGGGDEVRGSVRADRDVDLPDGASVLIRLSDTTSSGGAVELGSMLIEDVDSLPVDYRIPFDPDQIDSRNEYSVYASVRLGDQRLYWTDMVHLVITDGNPTKRDITVVAIE